MYVTRNSRKKVKRGLSNIVGSLLLIVLTIVAALLIGHFVFGLFASNSHDASVSVSDASVIIAGGNYKANGASIAVTVTDSGNDPLAISEIALGANGVQSALWKASASGGNGGGSTTNYITPAGGEYEVLSDGALLVEPGQSVTFQGLMPSSSGISLTVGQTVVFVVIGQDNVTSQSIINQYSVVVQD
ncbi:hypothetical protein HS7_16350 [Sulfolobales archaeon HS-7]|nr:hypothetical protein HS7_16350 [Sulfolobales archaeon HS-7]